MRPQYQQTHLDMLKAEAIVLPTSLEPSDIMICIMLSHPIAQYNSNNEYFIDIRADTNALNNIVNMPQQEPIASFASSILTVH